MEKIKVLLADNKEIFREGLARLLQEEENIEVVSQCSNGNQTIERVKNTEPDVVLMASDISDCDYVKTAQHINESSPEVKVVMLTDSQNETDLFSAMEAGATGYLLKDMKVGDLVKSIDLIRKGETVVSFPVSGKLADKFTEIRVGQVEVKDSLSPREAEILKLLAGGATNKDIAETLFIAQNTAKVHVKNLLEKLQLRNRQQAAAYAVQRRLTTGATEAEE